MSVVKKVLLLVQDHSDALKLFLASDQFTDDKKKTLVKATQTPVSKKCFVVWSSMDLGYTILDVHFASRRD